MFELGNYFGKNIRLFYMSTINVLHRSVNGQRRPQFIGSAPRRVYRGCWVGRKDRLLTQRTISQLTISYGRGKVTQIVMKLATSPSEMSGSTLGSPLLDSPVMVMAHTSCTRD